MHRVQTCGRGASVGRSIRDEQFGAGAYTLFLSPSSKTNPNLPTFFSAERTDFPKPGLARANVTTRWTSAVQMLRDWRQKPTCTRPLRVASSNMAPVLRQLSRSGYVFAFTLPAPLANLVDRIGDRWFLRLVHRIAAGRRRPLEGAEGAEALVGSIGPGVEECDRGGGGGGVEDGSGMAYGELVRRRATEGAWSTQIRYYREGLLTGPWTKSLETMLSLRNLEQSALSGSGSKLGGSGGGRRRRRSSSGAALFDTGPKGMLRAPTTVVWGSRDQALDMRIAVAGMRDYLVRGSQVVMVEGVGHWTPVDERGAGVFEGVLGWTLDGELEEGERDEEGKGKGLEEWVGEFGKISVVK